MKTEEVEALRDAYYAAAAKIHDAGGHEVAAHAAGLEAVALAVRAQDEARGGTLTAEQMEAIDFHVTRCEPLGVITQRDLIRHAAARGRTIAALTERADAAESALATLRQAVAKIRKPAGHDGDEESGQCDEDCDLCLWDALQAMVEDFSTPAEHPDTQRLATLQAIRELAERRVTFVGEDFTVGHRAAMDKVLRLLGDSGPSGGGERVSLTVFSSFGTSGVTKWNTEPTTPPYVAASEPTPEKDWRTVEEALRHNLSDAEEFSGPRAIGDAKRALFALARLKAEPRRAAEAMRERCAKKAEDAASSTDNEEAREVAEQLAKDLRALKL